MPLSDWIIRREGSEFVAEFENNQVSLGWEDGDVPPGESGEGRPYLRTLPRSKPFQIADATLMYPADLAQRGFFRGKQRCAWLTDAPAGDEGNSSLIGLRCMHQAIGPGRFGGEGLGGFFEFAIFRPGPTTYRFQIRAIAQHPSNGSYTLALFENRDVDAGPGKIVAVEWEWWVSEDPAIDPQPTQVVLIGRYSVSDDVPNFDQMVPVVCAFSPNYKSFGTPGGFVSGVAAQWSINRFVDNDTRVLRPSVTESLFISTSNNFSTPVSPKIIHYSVIRDGTAITELVIVTETWSPPSPGSPQVEIFETWSPPSPGLPNVRWDENWNFPDFNPITEYLEDFNT